MFAALTVAAMFALTAPADGVKADAVAVSNEVRRIAKRKRPTPKPREDLTPVEAWHRFCRPDGKVVIPKDERPKPYKKEKPNPHKRKPRK